MKLEQYKLDLLKDKINIELESHPMFFQLLETAFKNLEETMDYNSECKFEFFKDGKVVRISTNGTCKTTRTELRNNRDFVAATILLNDDATISLELSNGTLFRAKDIRELGERTKENSSAILNTYYSSSTYDQNGIQLSHSVFGDDYELMGEFKKINIESHVLAPNAHRPRITNSEIELPNLCSNGYLERAYREPDNLAIVYTEALNGINSETNEISITNREKSIYTVSCQYAHTVGALHELIATWSDKNQDYELQTYEYGETLSEAKESLKELLQVKLEMNKQQDSKIYKAILENKEKGKTK